jgi:hypothetical protein
VPLRARKKAIFAAASKASQAAASLAALSRTHSWPASRRVSRYQRDQRSVFSSECWIAGYRRRLRGIGTRRAMQGLLSARLTN